jgi:hypothetical protein
MPCCVQPSRQRATREGMVSYSERGSAHAGRRETWEIKNLTEATSGPTADTRMMDALLMAAYLSELGRQARMGLRAHCRMQRLVRRYRSVLDHIRDSVSKEDMASLEARALELLGTRGVRSIGYFFDDAQVLVFCAGVISLILFPPVRRNPESIERGQELRRALKLGNEGVLSNPNLRNSLAHIDERIARWHHQHGASGQFHNERLLVGAHEGDVEARDLIPREQVMRFYVAETGILSVLDQTLNLDEAAQSMRSLLKRVDRVLVELPVEMG